MTTVKYFTGIEGFVSYNKQHFFGDKSLIFHSLLLIISGALIGQIKVSRTFNIREDEMDQIVGVWTDTSLYLLTPHKEVSTATLDFLNNAIDFKLLKNSQFIGEKQLILKLLTRLNIQYKVFKDRIVYECMSLNPVKLSSGKLEIPTKEDVEEVAEMNLNFHREEYGQSTFRDIEHFRNFVINAIKSQTILLWKDHGEIVSMLNGTMNGSFFYVAHIYTKVSQRNQGYGVNLLHYVSSVMLKKGMKKIGLVSDRSNSISNTMFGKLGFLPIYEILNVVQK